MNPIAKHYMRLRFQKRVEALKKAGVPVNQQTVYDESIQVGVPVPRFGSEKHAGRRQADYAENRPAFVIDFIATGLMRLIASSFRRLSTSVFSNPVASPPASQPRLTNGQAKFSIGLGTFFALLGIAGCAYGLHVICKVHDAKHNWPTTQGVITSSGWRHERQATRVDSTAYHDVHYSYSVDGVDYLSDKVGIWYSGGKGGGKSDTGNIVRRYNKGDVVQVYYNPKDPNDALLDPGGVSFLWLSFPVALGALFLAGGISQAARAGRTVSKR